MFRYLFDEWVVVDLANIGSISIARVGDPLMVSNIGDDREEWFLESTFAKSFGLGEDARGVGDMIIAKEMDFLLREVVLDEGV